MRKLRICFISPPHPYLRDPKAQSPLGLLYVVSAVRERGFPVEFIDLSAKKLGDDFDLPVADVYGVTGTVLDSRACEAVAKSVRDKMVGSIVVLGGPISLSTGMLDMSLFDSVIFGEGEQVFMELLMDFPHVQKKYVGRRIEDLNSLVYPARDLLEGQLGGDVFANRQRYFEGGSTTFVTSRGCPFDCAFCASPRLWGRHIVYRSPKSIVDEIDHVVDRYGVRQFRFSDDNVTANRTRLMEMCDQLRGRKIAWRASIRVEPNDLEMFNAMRSAGCVEVCFGIESGDPEVLHVLNKKTTPRVNRTAIRNAKAAGLVVRILFMCGTPGETSKTADLNIEFLDSVEGEYDTIALTNFVPLPGTLVADEPAKCGCEIMSQDVDKFNLCFYSADGEENDWPNLVRPVGLSMEELTISKRRMRDYVKSTGKSNEG